MIIVPGNGCDDVYGANWYAWLQAQLSAALAKVELGDIVTGFGLRSDRKMDSARPNMATALRWQPP